MPARPHAPHTRQGPRVFPSAVQPTQRAIRRRQRGQGGAALPDERPWLLWCGSGALRPRTSWPRRSRGSGDQLAVRVSLSPRARSVAAMQIGVCQHTRARRRQHPVRPVAPPHDSGRLIWTGPFHEPVAQCAGRCSGAGKCTEDGFSVQTPRPPSAGTRLARTGPGDLPHRDNAGRDGIAAAARG
jgi:hypothetical protein